MFFRICQWTFGPGVFSVERFWTTNSVSLIAIGLGFFLFSFLFFLLLQCFLESLSNFCLLIIGLFYLSWFIGIELFAVFFYYPFILCRICCDSSSFIPNIGNFCLLSVFLVSMARGLSILLIIFSKNKLLVSLILSIDFLFSNLLIFFSHVYYLNQNIFKNKKGVLLIIKPR